VTAGRTIGLLVTGDVMTGGGIDQILPHPSEPEIDEQWVRSAVDYVRLAELANGPIPWPAAVDYIWGDALAERRARRSDLLIVNLETAITRSGTLWPKGINYRMNPANTPCLTAVGIDCCVLANNHVMDWGADGLGETLDALRAAHMVTVGAGRDLTEASRPAILGPEGARVLVFAVALPSSGVPEDWSALDHRAGVNVIECSEAAAGELAMRIRQGRKPGDLVVLSIHWGGNWEYEIAAEQRLFAHQLIEVAGVDVIHGHSSHHPKAIEIVRGKPVIYGCGDFLNDYEGIKGHEDYRAELVLAYRLALREGALVSLEMIPFRIRHFRLSRPDREELAWLHQTMHRECSRFGGSVTIEPSGSLRLRWR
jgi:poly-gamma-glutamate synthesis protein (capsule biosynthesis protein)